MRRLAELVVPGGAPDLTGHKLGQCFLDLAARLAVAQDAFIRSNICKYRNIIPELKMMRLALHICCSPDLVGDHDWTLPRLGDSRGIPDVGEILFMAFIEK